MSAFKTVTVTDTEVALNTASHARHSLVVRVPAGGSTVYVGQTGVSTSSDRVRAGETQVIRVASNVLAYAIAATGVSQDVSVEVVSNADLSIAIAPTAITQTYATAATTVPAATAVAPAATAATNSSPYGFAQAQADAIVVAVTALIADVLAVRKTQNQIIDVLQAARLAS